jgi:AraC family ethanolamine operon transcriptional activator
MLPGADRYKPTASRAPVAARRRCPVQRFQEFVDQAFADEFSLPAACKNLGVSERTLRLHCTKVLGVSPKRYVRMVRLKHAQQALAEADRKSVSVTTVAFDSGYFHLSRFATEYKRMFGESPSVTLRKGQVKPIHDEEIPVRFAQVRAASALHS